MRFLRRLWQFSALRFYWLNTKWNVGFWMNAKPCYEEKFYTYTDDLLDLEKNLDNVNLKFEFEKKRASYKKFIGYMYRGGLYLDNPGAQRSVDNETRAHWIKKRWI